MRIESLRLKNFKAFREAEMRDIPGMCVLAGANGSGKSTLFGVFGFLRDALADNVTVALAKMGGSRGFREVRSRGAEGCIEIEFKYRERASGPLYTYFLSLAESNGRPVVAREILKYRRGSKGKPWRFIDFENGAGQAAVNEAENVQDESELKREEQKVKSPDILAVKGLTQFQKFPAAKALGDLIENWHVSDFHIQRARPDQEAGYAEHLSREGENLSLVVQYLHNHHKPVFDRILDSLRRRVPGVTKVDAKTTEEGRVLLRFQDGAFEDPFLARHVSDGTIKMLAYLVLLHDPRPHPLLCVEEPENQLYPSLLEELAEEFRAYSSRGGQVFVSTHSPDFLNAARLDEVFLLVKKDGFARILRAKDDPQIEQYMRDEEEKLGALWRQGLFKDLDPS